jgi:hypothetical protein
MPKILFAFSAQKTHVKSLNHLNHLDATTSEWHFSYAETAILEHRDQKSSKPRRDIERPPGLTLLFAQI